MHYKQWPTAVSADYQSCQINTLGQWSEGGDFLFSVCNLIMFHKSLLRICFLLLNLKPTFCIPLYVSSWNQTHINHHFTNLSFLNTAVHTWPDDSSSEHLAACTAASSSSWIIGFGVSSGTNMDTTQAIWADRGPCCGDDTTGTKCPGLPEIRIKCSYILKQDSCTQTGHWKLSVPHHISWNMPRNFSGWYWLVELAIPKQWKSPN